mgnify:CR=1 FL=1
MNNIGKWIAVLLVLAAAGLASLAWWLGSRPPPVIVRQAPSGAAVIAAVQYPVVVATVKLEQGKPITASDVSVLNFPAGAPGTYQRPADVIGKVPSIDIAAGAMVMETGLRHGLALALAPGERAIAVAVDEVIGAGNRIEPGDYVDVFFTLRQGPEINRGQARLLASRQRVLAYGSTQSANQTSITARALWYNKPRLPPAPPYWRHRSIRSMICCWQHITDAWYWRCAHQPISRLPMPACLPRRPPC